jgi:hypothetical protein
VPRLQRSVDDGGHRRGLDRLAGHEAVGRRGHLGVQLGELPGRRLRADDRAAAAVPLGRLDDQLVQPVAHLRPLLGVGQHPGGHGVQQRLLAEVEPDQAGDERVRGDVVGHRGPRHVGQAQPAGPHRLGDHRVERLTDRGAVGAEGAVVEPAVQDVDGHPMLADRDLDPAVHPGPDVAGPHQRGTERRGEQPVLGERSVVASLGQDGDDRLPAAPRGCRGVQRLAQQRDGRRRVGYLRIRCGAQRGCGGADDVPRREGEAEALGHPQRVPDDDPAAGGPDDVGGGQRGPRLPGPRHPDGLRGPTRAVRDRPRREDAGPDGLGIAIGVAATPAGRPVDVGEEGGRRAVALLDAGRDPLPLGGRHDPRPRILHERLRPEPAVLPAAEGQAAAVALLGDRRRGLDQAGGTQPAEHRSENRVVVPQLPTLDRFIGGGGGVGGGDVGVHSSRSNQAPARPPASRRCLPPTMV